MKFSRITIDTEKMGGVPCIRNVRVPVATIVGMVANGMSHKDIMDAYPDIDMADIHEALLYAAEAVMERQIPLVHA